jgi:hypothetical protein
MRGPTKAGSGGPGQVEPSSAGPNHPGYRLLVGEVLVKTNDKVFAGEPLIELKTMSSGPACGGGTGCVARRVRNTPPPAKRPAAQTEVP